MGGSNNHDDGNNFSKHNSGSGGSGGGSGYGNGSQGGGNGSGWSVTHSDQPPNRQVTWSHNDQPQFKLTTGPTTLDGTGRVFSSWETINADGSKGGKQTYLEHRYMPQENYGFGISGGKLSGDQKQPVRGGFHDSYRKLTGGSD